jgi:hypothetical protein
MLSITACKKEIMTPVKSNSSNLLTKSQPNLKPAIEQGMLAFYSWKDFSSTVKYLNDRGTKFILEWNKEISFRSQEEIFEEIIEQENLKKDAEAALLGPDLSFDELKKIHVTHSEIYNLYLEKGLITEDAESDGNKSFRHNVFNPTFMCALSEDGFVMIGDTIYQFLPNKVKYIADGDFSKINRLKELNSSSSAENITIINYHKVTKSGGGDWSHSTDWIYDGAFKRIKADVVAMCPDLGDGVDAAFVSFYFEVSAQGWLFGWNYRNNYNPIDWTNCDWDWHEYYYPVEEPLDIYSYDYADSYFYTDYPMAGYSNHCKTYLFPNGWIGMSGYKFFNFNLYYSFSVSANVYGTISFTSN